MSPNGLTSTAGLKLGPLVLETLVKHYFERLRVTHKIPTTTSSDGVAHGRNQSGPALNDNLRQEELLYDQAFTIVKVSIVRFSFLSTSRPTCVCGLRAACPRPFGLDYAL